ncbi:TRAP C4-dicarboxylate transport system permease DctM subunit [Xanthobacter versatilis]|uniref:TRAP C4-dicarboxylate transport system permease DctM subunit n=2 Tax=Xanthobacter autotrophicus (strain ATCC BAA-1158 / Py2) TaxID=78245 RepID=A7IFJ1_XANP2|nr:TRAP C4-dicarboxylate transport system permease DctM subunit [Xanthobacter autotrophicus Py2]
MDRAITDPVITEPNMAHTHMLAPDEPAGGWRRGVLKVERALIKMVEIPAALLVLAEVVVLFVGVVMRYFVHSPIVWSDELASVLFIWLAMLGSVVALQRGEHMRMTALVGALPLPKRAVLETLAVAAPLIFLVAMLHPSLEYAEDEMFVTLPALDVPNTWKAAALPVGLALMGIVAMLKLVRNANPMQVAGVIAFLAALTAVGILGTPVLKTLGNINLVIFFVGLVAAGVFAGVPIAFSFGLATLAYLSFTTNAPLTVVVGRMDEGMSHLILLSVPLFVFLGMLIEMTGMARAMVGFLASLLGHVRGGLSYVLIGAMYLVSGISGSKAADMAAVTPVLFPEMIKRGAKPGDLVALLAATGAQTETIPPSLVLITIGSVTGVSIAALFAGGLMPAVVLGVMLCILVRWRYRNEDLSGVRRASRTEILRALAIAVPAIALPFVIRAAVMEGIATATEVSTIGIVYSVVVGLLIYRQFDFKRLMPMLTATAALSGAILLIIGAATGMAWALTQSGFSQELARVMGGLPGGAATFMVVSIVAFIILGSVLEGIPAIVLFGPLLFPIARSMGIHEVHYAMVVILSMGLGLFAPPFGVGYYCATAIGGVSPDAGMKPIVGYMAALLIGLALVAAVPWFSIGFLP